MFIYIIFPTYIATLIIIWYNIYIGFIKRYDSLSEIEIRRESALNGRRTL